MKKVLALALLLVFSSNHSFASPLVFKVKKDIEASELTELGRLDTTKFSQVRIGIKAVSVISDIDPRKFNTLLLKRSEMRATLENLKLTLSSSHQMVVLRQDEINDLDKEIEEFKSLNLASIFNVKISGADGNDEILLWNLEEKQLNHSIVVDSPPANIVFRVSGKASFSLNVWGQ